MKAHNRLTEEFVRSFVSVNSECKLRGIYHEKHEKFLELTCVCGKEFDTSWKSFKGRQGRKPKRTCRECTNKELSEKFKMNDEEYDQKKVAANIHIKHLESCKGSHKAILHECPECKREYKTTPNNVLRGVSTRCRKCADGELARKRANSLDVVMRELTERGLVWLSGEYINATSKLEVLCSCKKRKFVRRYAYIVGDNYRCSHCASSSSRAVHEIQTILDGLNVKFTTEKTYDDLLYVKKLRYDFMIENKVLLEYHGEQHYRDSSRFNDESLWMRDSIKINYALSKEIPLIIIPYTLQDNLELILNDLLKPGRMERLIETYGYVIDLYQITYGIESA